MNFFRAIEEKVKYIKQNFSAREIEEHFRLAFEVCRHGDSFQETSSVWYLLFDALYCFIKHRHWSHSFVFKELFVEFMVYDHRLPQEAAEILYQALHSKLSESTQVEFGESTNDSHKAERFFKYIFVQAFASEKEEDLIRELGFGYKFLNRIKSVVSSSLEKRSFSKGFASKNRTADQLFEKVFKKLSKSLAKNPMIMDLLKLQYILVNPMTIATKSDYKITKVVFKWILRNANKKYVNYARARITLAHRLSKVGCDDSIDLVVDRTISALEHANVMYTLDDSDRNKKRGLLSVGDLGQKIVGKAFAKKFWSKKRSIEELIHVRPILMKVCIEEIPESEETFVRELFFFHLKELPSLCVKPCIKKLKKICDPELVNQQMQSMGLTQVQLL